MTLIILMNCYWYLIQLLYYVICCIRYFRKITASKEGGAWNSFTRWRSPLFWTYLLDHVGHLGKHIASPVWYGVQSLPAGNYVNLDWKPEAVERPRGEIPLRHHPLKHWSPIMHSEKHGETRVFCKQQVNNEKQILHDNSDVVCGVLCRYLHYTSSS